MFDTSFRKEAMPLENGVNTLVNMSVYANHPSNEVWCKKVNQVQMIFVWQEALKVCITSATFSPGPFEPPRMQRHTLTHASLRFPSQRGRSLSSSVLLIDEAGTAGRPREAEV